MNKNKTDKFILKPLQWLFKKLLNNFIAVVAIIISILTYLNQIDQDRIQITQNKKLDSLNYQINAINYQPVLKIDEKVVDTFINWQIKMSKKDLIPYKKINPDSFLHQFVPASEPIKVDKDSILTKYIEGTIKFKTKINVRNTGRSSAKLISYVYFDTIWSGPYLRETVKEMLNDGRSKITPFPDFFKNEILPGDSTLLELDYNVQNFKEGKIIIHCALFYENELGYLYDTYFWLLIDNIPFVFSPQYRFRRIKEGFEVQSRLVPEKNEEIAFKLANQSFKIYELPETNEYKKLFHIISDSLYNR